MSDAQKLVVSSSPHLRDKGTVSTAMRDVFIALLPVAAAAIYFFKYYALFLIAICLVTAVITELVFRKVMRKRPTINDWSALVTGLFVALLFPATTPWWKGAIATFIAIGIVRELMGGLGWNRFNPALFGRVAMIILAPLFAIIDAQFTPLAVSFGSVDVLTQATPLAMLQQGMTMPSLEQLFIGFPGGAMAETSPLLLLVGAAYLFLRKHINWRIPLSILATVVVFTLLLGEDPLLHLLTGGLIIGAFFMATDWVTSPFTDKGKIIFGIGIGVLVVVFRVLLAPTEGVAFAILIMNAFVPLIERLTARPQFGQVRATVVQ